MIRIIVGPCSLAPVVAGARLKDLHPFVEYQCCAAISHLQHEVKIPKCRLRDVAGLTNSLPHPECNVLEFGVFQNWHGSC